MKSLNRKKRHNNKRRILGKEVRPRLSVYRSGQHIYAQVIDDAKGATIAASSDLKLPGKLKKAEKAYQVGKTLAEKAVSLGISQVVFDRGNFIYHGRVAKLAQGAREGGLKF